jgi:hypothetical protein
MKPIFLLPALACAALAADIPTLMKDFPKCSLQCLLDGAAEHGCKPTDYKCQCTKTAEITQTVTPCLVRAGCRLKQIGEAAKTISNICTELVAQGLLEVPADASHAVPGSESSNVPGAAARGMSPAWTGVALVATVVAMV